MANLMERFTTVRVVQAFGLDLARFQFDGDLTMAVLFLNADGAVYGRYGSRTESPPGHIHTAAGLRRAMEEALDLHARYPANAKSLEAKLGKPPPWPTPEAMPAHQGRENIRRADGSRGGCVHCHAAQDGEAWSLRAARRKIEDRHLWAWPSPEAVGLDLDPDRCATVRSVAEGSAAEKAGFRPHDQIVAMAGQPILSIADVQWALHTADAPLTVDAEISRGDAKMTLKLKLAADWRRSGDWTSRVLVWSVRHRLLGTEPLLAVEAADRKALGIEEGRMAFRVKGLPPNWVKEKAETPLRPGDVIVEVDGRSDLVTESRLLAYLFQEVPPDGAAKLTVLRDGKQEPLTLRMRW